MADVKHTQGPWFVGGGTGLLNQLAIEPSIGCAYGAGDEVKANALLMAAAPDLLEAAKLVIAWYEAENDHKGTDFWQRVDMCRESETAIRAAIAKATGAARATEGSV